MRSNVTMKSAGADLDSILDLNVLEPSTLKQNNAHYNILSETAGSNETHNFQKIKPVKRAA